MAVDQHGRRVAVHVIHSTGLQALHKIVITCTGAHCGPEEYVCALQIGIEDFRVMTESFGMQLDDDSLLALFCRVMTHLSATLTCCKGCVSIVHCLGALTKSSNMLPAAYSDIMLACMALHCSNWQQYMAILVLPDRVPKPWWNPKQLGVSYCIKALNPL